LAPIDSLLRRELDELVASMCKALNDPKRLLLLYALRYGRYTVSELCEIIEAPQSNTSQHLAVLRDRGLVEAERQGNNVMYSLRHPKVIEAIDILRGVMSDELERQTSLRAPVVRSATPKRPSRRRTRSATPSRRSPIRSWDSTSSTSASSTASTSTAPASPSATR
jgi:DNA-binding transcriptional ArsR family regulator